MWHFLLLSLFAYLVLPFGLNISAPFSPMSYETNKELSKRALLSTTANAIHLLNFSHPCQSKAERSSPPLIQIICERETLPDSFRMQDLVSTLGLYFMSTEYVLDYSDDSVAQVISFLEEDELVCPPIVVILLNDITVAYSFFEAVCSSIRLKWTHTLHCSEWIVVTTNPNISCMLARHNCVDLLTYIIALENGTAIQRKTRGLNLDFSNLKFQTDIWLESDLLSKFPELGKIKEVNMEGLHLSVAVLDGVEKYSYKVQYGNTTRYEGYSIALMELLAQQLNFNFTLVFPQDGGSYGSVKEDGSATGLTGMLARKEAALSPMGLIKNLNRLQAIDFTHTAMVHRRMHVIYKLAALDNKVDSTLIDIVDPELLLMSLGPVMVMVILASVTHILTKSCTARGPVGSFRRDFRSILSLSDHACFQVNTVNANQTGRILRASWAIFCFIIGTAYSAYLVTSFAVKPKELKINTLRNLLDTSDYSFGITNERTAVIDFFANSGDDHVHEAWLRLVEWNKTNPATFSNDESNHLSRVLAGGYAFIDRIFLDDVPLYVNISDQDLRIYQLHEFDSVGQGFLALPRNVFFKDIISRAVLNLDESGILQHLWVKFLITRPANDSNSMNFQREGEVTLSRILVLIYVTICGIGLALLSLAVEYACHIYLEARTGIESGEEAYKSQNCQC